MQLTYTCPREEGLESFQGIHKDCGVRCALGTPVCELCDLGQVIQTSEPLWSGQGGRS